MTERTLSCEEALRRLFEYIDHELDAHEHEEMERHLHICRSCYSRAEFEKLFKHRLGEAGQERAPSELASRIRKLFGDF